jgi:hypothetical protein
MLHFYFDTTLAYFLNPHFSFSLCDKHMGGTLNVIFVKYMHRMTIWGGGIRFWIYISPHPIII